jgi:hypothetical protein
MGGTDVSFYKNYVKESFSFLEKNGDVIDAAINVDSGCVNVILEQVIFHNYALHCKKDITYLLPQGTGDLRNIGVFQSAKMNRNYVHCFGYFKGLRISYAYLEWMLKSYYPDHFFRINDLVTANEI